MALLLLRRIGYAFAVLFAVVSIAFALIHISGDPLDGLVPPGATPEVEDRIRERFGLDRPLAVQYVTYLGRSIQGDFGESWRARQPAMDIVLERVPATLTLAITALALAGLLGVPAGLAGLPRNRGIGATSALILTVAGQAVPAFWIGTVLILVFGVKLGWLPTSGNEGISSLVLPAITLALYPASLIARLIRTGMLETLSDDYIRTARGKGLTDRAILRGHALRNASIPALAYFGVQIGFLLGGAVVVEGVFAYPGLGLLTLNAAADRDLPVIQAAIVVTAVGIIISGIITDFAVRRLDPRLRTAHRPQGAWT